MPSFFLSTLQLCKIDKEGNLLFFSLLVAIVMMNCYNDTLNCISRKSINENAHFRVLLLIVVSVLLLFTIDFLLAFF